ncbi:RusA family crossover junction endodeoxyribonuclease [Helicobacter ganmani]|uniref:RusA family crossover junction endodeoxyribonuclease n=1 Tax=Helicobacter ganmani TaxID=60246 RepID=UPI003A8B060B
MHLDIEFKTEKIPSVNHTYSMGKNGVFKEKEVSCFQRELSVFANIQAQKQKARFFKGEQLEVALTFSVKNMRRDLDNMLKPVLDALQGIVFKNDCQIMRLTCIKKESKKAYELVYISVSEWNP